MKVLPEITRQKKPQINVPQSIPIVMREKIEILLHFSPFFLHKQTWQWTQRIAMKNEMKIDATELNKHLYFCNEIQLINYFHIRCNVCTVLMNI